MASLASICSGIRYSPSPSWDTESGNSLSICSSSRELQHFHRKQQKLWTRTRTSKQQIHRRHSGRSRTIVGLGRSGSSSRPEASELVKKLSNLPPLPERSVVKADVSRRGFLFQLSDDGTAQEGPVELPPREVEIDPLAFPEASPLQIGASFVLTGAIAFLSLRSLRTRAQRAKTLKFRSAGVEPKEKIEDEAKAAALEMLKKAPEVPVPPPTALQSFLGAVVAGVIALAMYKVATTVEGSFAGKPVSMNYTVRNLTITVRTIINGLLYLATFVFGVNSIGLALYSVQLLLGGSPSPQDPPLEGVEPPSETDASSSESDSTE